MIEIFTFVLVAGLSVYVYLAHNQTNKKLKALLMKIRIEEATLNALVAYAEGDHTQLVTLQAIVANEEEMPTDMAARIAALVSPAP